MEIGNFTLIILMLISPGFCVASGMRYSCRYDIRAFSQNPTAQVIVFLIIALLIHIVAIPVYYLIASVILQYFDLGNLYNHLIPTPQAVVSQSKFPFIDWAATMTYVPAVFAFSFWVGSALIRLIENKTIRLKFFHGSLYDLVSGGNMPLLSCSVTTTTELNGSIVMYRGWLEEIVFTANSQIKYVSLSQVKKFLLSKQDRIETLYTSRKSSVSYWNDTATEKELLFIEGAEIANVLFSLYPISISAPEEAWSKKNLRRIFIFISYLFVFHLSFSPGFKLFGIGLLALLLTLNVLDFKRQSRS